MNPAETATSSEFISSIFLDNKTTLYYQSLGIAGGEVLTSVFKAYAIVIFTWHADLPQGIMRF
ncbi:hypothetical protein D1BOALGB6SA_10780 [Olavius sp. associated proteobacterium Delta 1]|nr:hypothetical protein D1BOALGB6SA_10780 [Olavius sp. associated proteobacterium Delta 1]